MKQETISILFFILKNRTLKNGEAPILLRVTIDGAYEEIRIQRSVAVNQWNQKLGMCKAKHREAKELNEYIRALHTKLNELHKTMLFEGALITPDILLKKLFSKETIRTVLTRFREHNEECRSRIDIDYAYSTVNRYDNCVKSFAIVIEREFGKRDITFNEFTGELIRKYELYLKVEKGLRQNTIVRYMKCIKKVSNLALANGWMKQDPFAGIKFKQPKTNPVFLTKEELDRIIDKDFKMERLALVRDIFIFCAFTGLAFIDVRNLRQEHLLKDNEGQYWIRKPREKTDTMCNIPLLDIPLEILQKYENHKTTIAKGVLLPVMCNQTMNSYLKEIADFCEIDKPISTHTARHSFSTSVALANGVSLSNLSKMLGHTSTRMTEHYAKVLDQSVGADMKMVQQRIG